MSVALEQELELLLAEPPHSVAEREASAFDTAAGAFKKSIVLFGAGGLGRKTLQGLRQAGLEPLAFADNSPKLWQSKIEGLQVLSPTEAVQRYGDRAVFVVTIWRAGGGHRFEQTQAELQRLGCRCVVPVGLLFWKFPQLFLDYYCLGLPLKVIAEREAILRTFACFQDEASQREFVAQVRWRLSLNFAALPSPGGEEHYFPENIFTLRSGEVFVDCGAFDGDSVAAFVRRQGETFQQIVALEPDPVNFRKMCERVAQYPEGIRKKIRLEQVGVSDFNGTLRFDANGSLSSAANPNGGLSIACVRLDDLLRETAPTYVKMDIEGAEPEALRGAAQVIRTFAPVLAISAYHKPNHLWCIPQLAKSMLDDYQLFLRPHNEECWDTVCYAVPAGRQAIS